MKRFTLVSVVFAAAMLTGCLARPNPRVSKVVKDSADEDSPDEELTFSYDGNGRIEEVEKTEGDDVRTWSLTWDGAQLVKVVVEDNDGATLTESTFELTYEGGKLVSSENEREDEKADSTFSYDDSGRLAKIEVSGGDEESTTDFDYGDDGQLASMATDNTRENVTTTGKLEFERSDGVLESFTLDQEGNDPQKFELTFDDEVKRLTQIFFETESVVAGEPAVVEGFIDFAYDDEGRVEKAEQTAKVGDIEVDVSTTEVEYDDGDASSLDMTANQVLLFGFFFDMKGTHYGTFDNTTTVPRLALPSW
jgi:hypothetical protein